MFHSVLAIPGVLTFVSWGANYNSAGDFVGLYLRNAGANTLHLVAIINSSVCLYSWAHGGIETISIQYLPKAFMISTRRSNVTGLVIKELTPRS